MTNFLNTLQQGDCLDLMKALPDGCIDLVVSDPPYGLKFMQNAWDYDMPSLDICKEMLRILKPGAFAVICFTPKQNLLSRMICRLEDAGFETGFTSLYWCYHQGFPKAMNVSKAMDRKLGIEGETVLNPLSKPTPQSDNIQQISHSTHKLGEPKSEYIPASDQAKEFNGSYAGYQPKPSVEVIIVVMKPLDQKTYVDQALSNGKGVTWLDGVRIPFEGESDKYAERQNVVMNTAVKTCYGDYGIADRIPNDLGRFPANLIVSDDALNDATDLEYSDSRFYDLDKWYESLLSNLDETARKTFPFLTVAKPSGTEKHRNLGNRKKNQRPIGQAFTEETAIHQDSEERGGNIHPTVKPLKLMSYLIMLGSRTGDTILDPFAGSGTTLVAAKSLNRNYIGFELDPIYHELATKRLESVQLQLFT